MDANQVVDIIKTLAPNNWVGVIILLIMFWIIYKVGGRTSKLGGFSATVTNLETKMGIIETLAHEVKGTVNSMLARLGEMELTLSKKAAHESPLKLTDSGNELLANTIGPVIDSQWDEIKSKYPKLGILNNPFDIEMYAQEIAPQVYEDGTSAVQKDQIKIELYKQGLSMEAFMPVIWIPIRDKILQEKGIVLPESD